jgi:AAA domain
MMHVAMGLEYRGRRVHRKEVVYLALEGQDGFPKRKEAFYRTYLKPGETVPLFNFCGAPLDLVKDHKLLIANIKAQATGAPGCVVIDTLNRSLNGSESKDEDMSAYLRAADAIQHAFDCVVIIIHHCGVEGTRPRGHTSQTGAADVQISVKKDEAGIVTATVELAKDMAEGATFASRLEKVPLGIDQDGDEIFSLVAVPVEAEDVLEGVTAAATAAKERRTTAQREFDESVTEALDTRGQIIRVRGDGPKVKGVEVCHVRDEFFKRHATGEADAKKRHEATKKAFNRALQDEKLSKNYPRWVDGEKEWLWRLREEVGPGAGHGTSGHSLRKGECRVPDVPVPPCGTNRDKAGHVPDVPDLDITSVNGVSGPAPGSW